MSEANFFKAATADNRDPDTQPQRQWGTARPGRLAVLVAAALALLLPVRAAAYTYSKSITIDRSQISVGSCGATLTDYPLLFSVTDPDLAHTSSSGKVTDPQGDDIIFRAEDDATCGGVGLAPCTLDHEIEKYVSGTGELVAWVRVPSVYTNDGGNTSDTVIYVYYGDRGVTSPTANPAGVWDTSFKGVYHLEEDVTDEATGATHDDSTGVNDGTQNRNVEATGKIGDGQDFDPDVAPNNDYIDIPNVIGAAGTVTLSAWIKHDNLLATHRDRYVELQNNVVIRHDGPVGLGQLHFYVRLDGGAAQGVRSAAGALSNGAWTHVAGTFDGTTATLFLNGAQVGTQAITGTSLDISAFGHISDEADENMDGMIDEVRISDTARTACWIGAEFENQLDPGDIGSPGFYTVGSEVALSCGSNLVMVTADGTFGNGYDTDQKTLFESWGYTVTALDGTLAQAAYDTAAASNEVMFISDTAPPTAGTKARTQSIGVVSENTSTWNTLMYSGSSSTGSSTGSDITVTDDTHFITSPFSAGALTVYSPNAARGTWNLALPAGANLLATVAGNSFLFAFETGAELYSSNFAAGRRVMIGTITSRPDRWTADLQLLVRRSLSHATCGPYDFFKPITIDRGQILGTCGATLTDFPMLFSSTDPDLAHTSSGGDVTDLDGDDIIFRGLDPATCGAAPPCNLDHEIEKYVNTTGELVAWVRIPLVNTAAALSDTTIYVHYGNGSVSSPTENPAGVWDANYMAVWHLEEQVTDEATGATHDDSTGVNNGVQNNNDDAAGEIATAQDFDGAGDFITVADDDSLSFGDSTTDSPFSVSAWVFADTATSNVIVAKDSSASGEWDFYIRSGGVGALALIVNDGTLSNKLGKQTDAAFPTGSWHHVAASYDATPPYAFDDIKLYIDGAQPAQSNYSAGAYVAMHNTTTPVQIGTWDGGGNGYDMHGRIDEVRVSNTVRSACWIAAEYNNQVWPDKAVTPSPVPSSPSSGFYTIGAAVATAVELLSFEARAQDGAVDLVWQTGTELDNLGFHVYRSLSDSGPYERITTSLIPGLGSSPEGARYGYRDVGLVNGITYFYQLEDVETTGKTERHGPVSATPQPGATSETEADEGAPADSEDPSETASSWIRYGDPEATSLSVLERGEGQVVVELRTGGFWALPDEDGSVWLQIPGFEETQEPGAPALPVMRPWLEAVAGRKVKLASVVGRDVVAFDSLRPAVTGAPELWESEDGTLHAGQRRKRPGKAFQAAGLYPEQAAELLGTAFQGEVKKAQLELSPLRWDRSAGRLLLARRLRVRVVFAGREKGELSRGGARGRKPRAGKTRLSEGVVARLEVAAPGLYGVRFEELFGSRGRGVSVSELSLSHQGEAVAFHVEPGGKRFSPGSVLFFVSTGAQLNPYGTQAVYELSVASGGVQVPLASAAPSGWTVASYWQRVALEEDRLYKPTLFSSPDLWLWDYITSRNTKGYLFSLSAPAASAEPGQLTLWLQGGSDYPADPDHHVRVSVNGQALGEASWDGMQPYVLEAELWSGLLLEGENRLEITNLGDTGASYSLVILDRFAVSYPRQLVAQAGVLAGRFSESGTAEVQAVSAGAYLLDTTEPDPRWLSGAVATPSGVRFAAEAGREYRVVSPEALLRPVVRLAGPSTLRDVTNRAEYLVVGPRAFLAAAEPLLEQRRSQGLETLAVAIEEVYDGFGFGETRPEALRDFLAYAYHSWQLSPRYVLLLGDASYDFKDHLGMGVGNPVPPYMIQDAYMWTVSDPAYAAVNGEDPLPDLALGRLPAQSLEQAQVLVRKILAWENAGFDLAGRAVLVADNSDQAGDFEGDAERIAQTTLADRDVERIYLSQLRGATRATVIDSFDRGSSLMSYLGHGAIAIWASENVFNIMDVPTLAPQPQQPLLLTMNCLNGYFHLPTTMNSLAEELLKAEDKGVIGAFAPSSMSLHWAARIYHEALVAELSSGRHERLGDALLAAQNTYADSGARPELLRIYQLLADPALRIR